MDTMPTLALVMVVAVLLVVWLFLAHMISSRREDGRLRFLLSLMETPPDSSDRPSRTAQRPPAKLPESRPTNSLQAPTDEVVSRSDSRIAQSLWQEMPVVFAAALRGRAM